MKVYLLKDCTPYSKLKQDNTVFELENQNDFEQATLDNDGEVFIEDTKSYLLTKTNRCYVIFYENTDVKIKLYNKLKESMNGELYGTRNQNI